MEDNAENRPFLDPSRDKCCRWACQTPLFIQTSDDDDDDRGLNKKISCAFSGVKSFPFERIIFQFWRPRDEGGRLALECLRNPFSAARYDKLLCDIYRPRSLKYRYSIDDDDDDGNPPWIISGGAVATAFLNQFPEVVPDLTLHRGSDPLIDCGLKCDLTCCVMLPVFDDGDKSCLGVVECSMRRPDLLLPIFSVLKRELDRKGLSIYHLQGSWPYKTITGNLELAKIEIEKGLKIACESHDLTLGQVWVSYEKKGENDPRRFLVKLSGYSVQSDDGPLSSVKDFYNKLDVISLEKNGEGLVWKSLQNHQPFLCRNIYKLGDNKGLLALLSANTKCTSLVICLRSTHTGELDYSFEFFWHCNRNHSILLETLLLMLKKYLPSFKFASGEQLGDKVSVVDVENASSNLEGEDDYDLAVIATFRNKTSQFYLPRLSTVEIVMETLRKEFELDPAQTYAVEFEVSSGQWSRLVCLESCRRIGDMGVIKLRVRAEGREIALKWITNC